MIKVSVPATTANLGPGFDTLGMALQYCNTVEMEEREMGLTIDIEGEGEDHLPRDENNIVYRSACEVFDLVGYQPKGLWLKLVNRIPVARGLGSSSAAIVGGVLAANELSGGRLDQEAILDLAIRIEGHPDNVTPAYLGGMTVSCMTEDRTNYIKTAFPPELKTVVAVPEFPLSTAEARRILPREVSLQDAVYNVSRSSLLVAAVLTGKYDLLSVAMNDKLHQPYRAKLIPGLEHVFEAGKQAGAHAVVISGSGPSIIAFATADVEPIGRAMSDAFARNGINSRIIIAGICAEGAVISRSCPEKDAVAS
jgi:homoserine kinase